MNSKSIPANADYIHAMRAYREGRYSVALEHFTWAMDWFLYKHMWSLADCAHIQEFRLMCYQKIREKGKSHE